MKQSTKRHRPPQISFVSATGRARAIRRVAVVALTGASTNELRDAIAWAKRYRPRPLVVAADGGFDTCRAARIRPNLFVGDLDSAVAAPTGIPSRVYPMAKDFSDFSGALAEIRARRCDLVVVAGLLGGRLDHEWANVQEVGSAAPNLAGVIAPTGRGLIVVTSGSVRARATAGALVSIFARGGPAVVSVRGTRWPLSRRRLVPGSLGLSNVGEGDLVMDVHRGVAALVFPKPD